MMNLVLDAFAAHCKRQGHPKVWSQHYDIWNEPIGELAVSMPELEYEAMSAFAALVPFMVIPTVGTSWLIVDRSDREHRHLAVVKLYIKHQELACDAWVVPHFIDDDGSLSFDAPIDGLDVESNTRDALVSVAKGRFARVGWDDDIDFSRAAVIAEGMMP